MVFYPKSFLLSKLTKIFRFKNIVIEILLGISYEGS